MLKLMGIITRFPIDSLGLKETLEKLPTWTNSRIDELLPFAVASVDAKPQDEN